MGAPAAEASGPLSPMTSPPRPARAAARLLPALLAVLLVIAPLAADAVTRRLVSLGCIVLVGLWMLLEIPGVSDLSSHALLASGALIGALTLVFQDILRDFASGLTVLLEDRYAIGDHVSISDHMGD